MKKYTLSNTLLNEDVIKVDDGDALRSFLVSVGLDSLSPNLALTITDTTGQTRTLAGAELLAWAQEES